MQEDLEFQVRLFDGYCAVRARRRGAPRFKPLVVGTGESAGAALFRAGENLIALEQADEKPTAKAIHMPDIFTAKEMQDFINGYLETALWSSNDLDTEIPLDENYSVADIELESSLQMEKECYEFVTNNADDIREYCERRDYDPSQGSPMAYAGHDFWLTRNHHGAGFWARVELGDLGDRLTKAAHGYGECILMPVSGGKLGIN
jgi:hypothetical protein